MEAVIIVKNVSPCVCASSRVTRQPVNEPIKLKKSKMIAKAFAKKKDMGKDDDNDRLSLSFESASHDDAIGMWMNSCLPEKLD